MAKKISYSTRDFAGVREELVNLSKEYYPELVKNTNDASIFSVMLDLNAAIGDNLHYHIDRVWQETMLDFAQQRKSLFHIAKTYGMRIPGNRPSVSLCDLSINVPVRGDKEDERYLGIMRSGAQVSGGGQTFETIEDVDFSNPFNDKGEPNRLKIPNFDSNNKLISYTITKREAVVNGVSRVFRRVITPQDQKPFLKLYLPEQNILGVVSVIHKEGTNFTSNPSSSEFSNSTNKWYEVKSLMEDKVFIPNPTSASDKKNFIAGDNKRVTNKFISEYTPEGYMSVTFGSGTIDPLDNLDSFNNGSLKVSLGSYLNNLSLGATPRANSTVFIKYRVGGGKDTNLGVNVITSVDNVEFNVSGPLTNVNNQVVQSLRVANVTPAVGGADQPTIEEIRNMVGYNFSAQNRAVTLNDYKSLIETMPSTYGAPAKVNVMEEDNKIRIKLLSYNSDGSLTDTVSTTLKNNILNYLSNYRMINDYLDIVSGEVIDLGLEIDLVIDKNTTQTDVLKDVIESATNYFTIEGRKMGDPLFVGELKKTVGDVVGVVNVVDLRVFGKTEGEYSMAEVSQGYVSEATKEIQQSDSTVYMKNNQIFQIRFPKKDIKVRIKTLSSTTF
jgi:hypothetical protein